MSKMEELKKEMKKQIDKVDKERRPLVIPPDPWNGEYDAGRRDGMECALEMLEEKMNS